MTSTLIWSLQHKIKSRLSILGRIKQRNYNSCIGLVNHIRFNDSHWEKLGNEMVTGADPGYLMGRQLWLGGVGVPTYKPTTLLQFPKDCIKSRNICPWGPPPLQSRQCHKPFSNLWLVAETISRSILNKSDARQQRDIQICSRYHRHRRFPSVNELYTTVGFNVLFTHCCKSDRHCYSHLYT